MYFYLPHLIQHCLFCRPSDSTVPEDAGFEPRKNMRIFMRLCPNLRYRLPCHS